jgi:hypothetical protein
MGKVSELNEVHLSASGQQVAKVHSGPSGKAELCELHPECPG